MTSGVKSAASKAVEAASNAASSDIVAKVTTTAKVVPDSTADYANRVLHGGPPHAASHTPQVESGQTFYYPPLNYFNYKRRNPANRSPSPDWRSNRAAVRELRRDRQLGINNAEKIDVRELQVMQAEAQLAGSKNLSGRHGYVFSELFPFIYHYF